MIRTQVQLTEAQMRTLRRLATDRRVSVAELIREGVDLLVRTGRLVDDQEQRRRALSAAGRFRSGCSNLATEHDQYLTEAYRQ